MIRLIILIVAFSLSVAGFSAFAAGDSPVVAATAPSTAPVTNKLGCADPAASVATANTEAPIQTASASPADAPRVIFQLSTAEDAPTILRFVTNYLAVEPTARVAVVGYSGGIDFMLNDAKDANGRPYADQMAALSARGVAFKVCNNTLKARNLTAAAVSAPATVVPGAVNEIIRLQTNEGYAYFRN